MLRLTAIISMTLDHAALLLIQYGVMGTLQAGSESYMMWNAIYTGLRTVGRMAFPIFALLLVQGYGRTKNFRNYALRLFLLALISEIPFDWMVTGHWGVDLTYQNTVYTLLIGLLTIKAAETVNLRIQKRQMEKGTYTPSMGGLPTPAYFGVWAVAALAGCLCAHVMDTDYGWEGVALILLLYLLRGNKLQQCLLGALWSMAAIMDFRLPYIFGYMAAFAVIYILRDRPPLFPALRQEGGAALRLATYLYYPAHLLVLWAIYCTVFLK